MNVLRAPLSPSRPHPEMLPNSDCTDFPRSWNSYLLRKIALRASYREICWLKKRSAPL